MKAAKKIIGLVLTLLPALAFADANLRNCMYDYNPRVYDFSVDGISEVFVDGRAVESSILDLKVGDLFIDEDGIIQVVDDIYIDASGNIEINSSMPKNIRSFMNMISIPEQSIEIETEDWTVYGEDLMLDQNYVAQTESEKSESRAATQVSSSGMLSKAMPVKERDMTPTLSVTIPISKASTKEIANAAGTSTNNVEKSGIKNTSGTSLKFTAEFPYAKKKFQVTPHVDLPYTQVFRKKCWSPYRKSYWTTTNWYHKGYAKLDVDLDLYFGVGLNLEFDGKIGRSISICELTYPVVTAGLYFTPEAVASANVRLQKYTHFIYAGGFTCDLDGEYVVCVPHNFNSNTTSKETYTGLSLDGSVIGLAGLYVGPKVGISVSGFDLASISAKAGPEAKLVLPVFHATSYDDPKNILNSSYTSDHTSAGVKDLENSNFSMYIKASVTGSLIKNIISTTFLTWKSSPLIDLPKDIKKFSIDENRK